MVSTKKLKATFCVKVTKHFNVSGTKFHLEQSGSFSAKLEDLWTSEGAIGYFKIN